MFYFPVDCALIPQLTKDLDFFDCLVTYTEFAKAEVLKNQPELKGKIKVVPHGNNPKHFYPLPSEESKAFRKEYFGDNADKFIICNVNRNQPRKDISCTILGFSEYLKINPNAYLYLHMNPHDPMGNDIRAIMMQLELEEDVHYQLPPKEKENHGFDVQTLNKVYNACDVYLTTANGEGWGLSFSEATACRLPTIAPRHTSLAEIGVTSALFLEDFEMRVHVIDNVIRPHCFVDEVEEKLEIIHDEISKQFYILKQRLDNGEKFVANLSWDSVCKRWIEYFKETF